MQKKATRDLETLKTSPQLDAAIEGVHEAVEIARAAETEIKQTAATFAEYEQGGMVHNSNFVRALERVKIYPDGSFETFVPEA